MAKVPFTIDGKKCEAEEGENLVDAAAENGVYIPTLCYTPKEKCLGTCRICTVRVNGRVNAACTLSVEKGIDLEVNSEEMKNTRQGLVELLFSEGNHFCPSCEKSGDCTLQALGYEMQMMVSRFHYRFNNRDIDFEAEKIILENNRCVLCKKCTHRFRDQDGHRVFSFEGKGESLHVNMDIDRANKMTEQKIDEAVNLCPVGAILRKGKGFDRAYGERTYDKESISQKNVVKKDE
jgi:[NiFe] hydrogenase diaphorase moiety small subunit